MATEPEVEAKARELYEALRKADSGIPNWECLDTNDPYDMGMRLTAITKARIALADVT